MYSADDIPVMYFSFWYKPSERALRIGIFHASNAMASGVGGFLANGINNLNGAGGLSAWRWIFIVSPDKPFRRDATGQHTADRRGDVGHHGFARILPSFDISGDNFCA